MGGWAGALVKAGEWALRLACLNLLWILFTFLGGGVLGLFPATAAVFSVIRKGLVDEGKAFPLFRTFWAFYRTDWIPMNVLMLIYSVMGLGLLLDFRLVRGWEGAAQPWVVLFLIFALSVYLLSLLHLFPLYAHYRLKLREYVLSGGTIVCDSVYGSPHFYDSAVQVFNDMFPESRFRVLPPDHPLFHMLIPFNAFKASKITRGHQFVFHL